MADEYIKRSDVQDALNSAISDWNKDCGIARMEYLRIRLNNIPAVDAVEVVRCKDCKYGVPTKNGFFDDMIACENKDSPCGYSSWLCQLDWFCADGERRGNDGD